MKRRQRSKVRGKWREGPDPERSMEPKENSGWGEIAGGKKDRKTLKNRHVYQSILNCL